MKNNIMNKMNKMEVQEIQVTVRYKSKKSKRIQIKNSDDAYRFFKTIFNAGTIDWTEEVVLLCFNYAMEVIGYYKVASGGMTSVPIDSRVIFGVASNCFATSIMLAHNHPTGRLAPSYADLEVTKKLKAGGEILGIQLLDHLIVTSEGFYYFADNNQL